MNFLEERILKDGVVKGGQFLNHRMDDGSGSLLFRKQD